MDLFQGQFKSTLTCPDCNNIQIAFDPFTTVSLPIPHKTEVTFYWLPPHPGKKGMFKGALKLNLAQENFMSVKTRIAVQASEHYERCISPYDFTISIVESDGR